MISAEEITLHERAWLLLPWLANGRIAPADRENVEQHVRRCAACARELEVQELMCRALGEPDRVTYAPGPSFRKLMERIDAAESTTAEPRVRESSRRSAAPLGQVSMWRPPGLAWAASFLLLVGMSAMLATAYRWSEPVYRTHTDVSAVSPNVLHIALDHSLTLGQIEELLQADGARIVEGPGNTGVIGVTPNTLIAGQTSQPAANQQLRQLAQRLRSDSRVLWVQPLAAPDR